MSSEFDMIEKRENVLLSSCSTFRIGGPAKMIVYPASIEEISAAVSYCKEKNIRYMILGNGSNVLFSDEGFDGIIIQIFNRFNDITIDGNEIYAEAGATLARLAGVARDNCLAGLEFAAGIPGTLGGALVMNAGAYGGEVKDVVVYADILCEDGTVKRFTRDEMDFSYRHSIVTENMVVLGARLSLTLGDRQEIDAKMNDLREKRVSKQPLEYPSAGSTFKRPEGYFAGKLIEDAGLKGYKCGGAMVSDKHSGFVINFSGATCKDVLSLIEHVQNTVMDKFGVMLEPEVKIIK